MYCKNCGKEIPNDSYYCMFCGAHLQNAEAPALADRSDYPSSSMERLYEDIMKNKVVPNLKCPSTATYPRYKECMSKEISGLFSGKQTVIETYADSMNSYGAIIRVGIRIRLNSHKEYDGVAFKESNSVSYSLYRYL